MIELPDADRGSDRPFGVAEVDDLEERRLSRLERFTASDQVIGQLLPLAGLELEGEPAGNEEILVRHDEASFGRERKHLATLVRVEVATRLRRPPGGQSVLTDPQHAHTEHVVDLLEERARRLCVALLRADLCLLMHRDEAGHLRIGVGIEERLEASDRLIVALLLAQDTNDDEHHLLGLIGVRVELDVVLVAGDCLVQLPHGLAQSTGVV